ncbi:MAG: glycoside hydrolase family 3 C-terminal domain-containing protein [Lachnospiraceae bacterium]|nr:glycoside hydrolase family 3 C-terminal domain-containing protein [Lachnospiraceae bacterium]
MVKTDRGKRRYSGTPDNAVSRREIENREVARKAAAEGIVLLKNEGVLPLKKGARVALFGGGAVKTVKGGSGSGDVNERESVSIYQGFAEAGLELSNQEWLDRFAAVYQKAREDWRSIIMEETERSESKRLLDSYNRHRFHMPPGDSMKDSDFEGADTGFYVISRTAGESADRFTQEGDYYLTREEKEQLVRLSEHCRNTAVILNTGGPIDLKDILAIPNLKVLIYVSQPGMEGGHALADLVMGKATPGGKLTDTWAWEYADYPSAETFSRPGPDALKERYEEGIYVGYRYFDSFEKEVVYPFGFGLSYTEFSIKTEKITAGMAGENRVEVTVLVTNKGEQFCGREVVQVYVSCPQTGLPKEFRRLAGFAKTKLLAPGESQNLTITFDGKAIASFDEVQSGWVIEKGRYGIWVGNSSRNLELSGVVLVERETLLEPVRHICPVQEPLEELVCDREARLRQEQTWNALAEEKKLPVVFFVPGKEKGESGSGMTAGSRIEVIEKKTEELVRKLSDSQLISMVVGELSAEYDQTIGAAGIRVPGSAGETSSVLEADYGIDGMIMADGPAGLRLAKSYEVDCRDGTIKNPGILGALEGGFFLSHEESEHRKRYYQYCTAIPVGTLLAQTWDEALLETVGQAIGREMEEFGISLWLAPGMNIHRNPLCGRNFEYYSEDPLVSGKMAAAITRGVQSVPGRGTTIKHFACNNRENNRRWSDSVLSERALRELYLRGFEIAVKEAQPAAIMTSYNQINGQHAANSWDLCTRAAREEWGFLGLIMTDWSTTRPGQSIPWMCAAAGNDLIMPGCPKDVESIQQAMADGSLDRETLQECVRRILTVMFRLQENGTNQE